MKRRAALIVRHDVSFNLHPSFFADSLFDRKLTAGERSLAVEVWDLSGRPV